MTRLRSRSVALATAFTLLFVIAPVREAFAVATVTGAGIRITDPAGTPVAGAKISLTFNGEIKAAKTDDDGVVAIVVGGSGAAVKPGAIVLDEDGSGSILYPGGPPGGEPF